MRSLYLNSPSESTFSVFICSDPGVNHENISLCCNIRETTGRSKKHERHREYNISWHTLRQDKFKELTHCFFSLSVRCQTLSPPFSKPIYAQCIQPIPRAVSLCALPSPAVLGRPPVSVPLLAVPVLWKRFFKPVRACCRRDGQSIEAIFS